MSDKSNADKIRVEGDRLMFHTQLLTLRGMDWKETHEILRRFKRRFGKYPPVTQDREMRREMLELWRQTPTEDQKRILKIMEDEDD